VRSGTLNPGCAGHHQTTQKTKKEKSMITLLAIFGGIAVFAFLAFQIAKS